MKTFLLLVAFVAALVLPGASFAQTDVWNAGFVPNSSGSGSTRAWSGPGFNYSSAAAARGPSVTAGTGGLTIIESKVVATGDGRVLTLAAQRLASNSNIFAALGALARGPYGLAASIALPYVISWIAGDNGQDIRIGPTGALEKLPDGTCLVSPCYNFSYHTLQDGWGTPVQWLPSYAQACAAVPAEYGNHGGWTYRNPRLSGTNCVIDQWTTTFQYSSSLNVFTQSRTPDTSAGWLPASLDDIAPYMTPRVPSPGILNDLANAGSPILTTPVSVTTVTPPPALAPYVQTTTYPKPADKTTSVTVPGNPYALPNNTPTVTNQNTSSASLNPGSTSRTGIAPTDSAVPTAGPVATPTQSTSTSTYNPTTNATTTSTVVSQDAAQQVSTSTTTTTISNTTNSSSLSYSTTNVTNITNTTTSTPLAPTKTDTNTDPTKATPPDPVDPCVQNPDSIGCLKLGTAPAAEKIPQTNVPVTWVPVIFAGGGSCPADIPVSMAFSHMSKSVSISFAPMCDLMSTLAPLFLALGAAAAAWLFMEGLKA